MIQYVNSSFIFYLSSHLITHSVVIPFNGCFIIIDVYMIDIKVVKSSFSYSYYYYYYYYYLYGYYYYYLYENNSSISISKFHPSYLLEMSYNFLYLSTLNDHLISHLSYLSILNDYRLISHLSCPMTSLSIT